MPSVPSLETRTKAEAIQWTAFLLIAAGLGLLWMPVATYFEEEPVFPLRNLTWTVGAGVLYALAFRLLARRKGREPSLFFATTFPLIACLMRSLATWLTGSEHRFSEFSPSELIATILFAYVCFGLVTIPVAGIHLAGIRWSHRWTEKWAQGAGRRSVRHGLFAVGCAALVIATEGPPMVFGDRISAQKISARYGFTLPPNSAVIARSSSSLGTGEAVWIRASLPIRWPPVAESQIVNDPSEESSIMTRAIEEAGADFVGANYKVQQVKWRQGDMKVRANLVRIGATDYLEVIAW